MKPSGDARPIGFSAIGAFFFFGALMASYAAITLLYPGTILDQGWKLNPNAHLELAANGRIIALPFIILAATLALAGVGWFKRRFWGWLLGFLLIAINLGGDVFHLVAGEILKGLVGVLIAGLLLICMARPGVRGYFKRQVGLH
jgi:hypothetical protein